MGAKQHRAASKRNRKLEAKNPVEAKKRQSVETITPNEAVWYENAVLWGVIALVGGAITALSRDCRFLFLTLPLLSLLVYKRTAGRRRIVLTTAAFGILCLAVVGLWYKFRPELRMEALASPSNVMPEQIAPPKPQPETSDEKISDIKTLVNDYAQAHNGDAPTIAWVDEQLRAQGKTFHLKMAAQPSKIPAIDVEDSSGLTFDHVTTTHSGIKMRNSPNNKFDHVAVDMTPPPHSSDEPCPDKNNSIGYMTDGERVYPCKHAFEAKTETGTPALGTIALVHTQVSGLHIGGNTILSSPAGAFTATDSTIMNSSIDGNKMGPKSDFKHER
jgi:hypothetical protein